MGYEALYEIKMIGAAFAILPFLNLFAENSPLYNNGLRQVDVGWVEQQARSNSKINAGPAESASTCIY